MAGLYLTILWKEFKADNKIYVSTIIGVLCAVIHLIIACTNVAPSLAYDKFHLNAVGCFSCYVHGIDYLGNSHYHNTFPRLSRL